MVISDERLPLECREGNVCVDAPAGDDPARKVAGRGSRGYSRLPPRRPDDGRTAPVMRCLSRAPYHTISAVRLIGGGHMPLPREVSLAHHGILFLDKLVESATMSLKCCANRSRTASQADDLAGISDLTALAAHASRVQAATVELIPHRQDRILGPERHLLLGRSVVAHYETSMLRSKAATGLLPKYALVTWLSACA
jgi:Magnesium chelatase, subunit ChlI